MGSQWTNTAGFAGGRWKTASRQQPVTRYCLPGALITFTALFSTAVISSAKDTRTLEQAVTQGRAAVDARLRYEHAEQDNALKDADAATLRARLGYRTDSWQGLDAFAEFEGTFSLGDEGFNSGAPFLDATNGNTGFTTIADPTDEEINRAWLRFRGVPDMTIKLGRQRIVLDNARFVGNVGWRQNEQTFDAARVINESLPDLTLSYAWVRKQNFVLFNDNKMNTHLLNARYAPAPQLTLTGYGYLIDYRNDSGPRAPGTPDHKVFGLRAVGELGAWRYALEYADQSDHADAPARVDAEYYLAQLGVQAGPIAFRAAYEVLGGDGTFGFQTPLATNHAFQGFADLFLATPASGVRDGQVAIVGEHAGFRATATYHDFQPDHGDGDLGREIDLVLAKPITTRLEALVKYADYDADDFGVDAERFWMQAEYAF